MLLPHVIQETGNAAVGKQRGPVGEKTRAQDVPAKDLPFVRAEVPLRELGIGQNLPTTLLVQFRGNGRDDAVLPKESAHRLDINASARQVDQVADGVVAVGE